MDYKKLLDKRNSNNTFAKKNDIVITAISAGFAEGEISIKPEHLNSMGTVHGGCIFSLADTIGGSAAASRGFMTATLSSQINFLEPAKNVEKLIATAKEVRHGRTVLVIEIDVKDEKGNLIAKAINTQYNLGKKIDTGE